MNKGKNTRHQLLEVALQIAEGQGVKGLTQTNVAAAAGVRQSHLTYYFPRKADLLAAVLDASHQAQKPNKSAKRAQSSDERSPQAALQLLENLFLNRNRMRFFLGILSEAQEEEELRKILSNHMDSFAHEIAYHFGREDDDEAVMAMLDYLRGKCLRLLLKDGQRAKLKIDIRSSAERFGLIVD